MALPLVFQLVFTFSVSRVSWETKIEQKSKAAKFNSGFKKIKLKIF